MVAVWAVLVFWAIGCVVSEELGALSLADLGLSKRPDLTLVNTTSDVMERMVALYDSLENAEMDILHTRYSLHNTTNHDGETSFDFLYYGRDQDSYQVEAAELILPRPPKDNPAPVVTVLGGTGKPIRASAASDPSWVVYDLREHCRATDLLRVRIQDCAGCRATLELVLRTTVHRRTKRSLTTTPECKEDKWCCMKSMRVSFKDIGWDWVVKPKTFEARMCRGKCPKRYTNFATNHALIQALMHKVRHKESPRPCCTPRRLRGLNILHYNDKTPPELVVTKWKGMIVKECACS